jgi:hypothetical protein
LYGFIKVLNTVLFGVRGPLITILSGQEGIESPHEVVEKQIPVAIPVTGNSKNDSPKNFFIIIIL